MERLSISDAATHDAGRFATLRVHRQFEYLESQINRAIKSCSPGSVHDVRVAVRRYTQALAICRQFFKSPEMRKTRRRLKGIMGRAGHVRDCDVALKLAAKFPGPHSESLRSKVQTRRAAEAVILLAELKKFKNRQISLEWQVRSDDSGSETIQQLARRTLRRIAKDFLKQGNRISAPSDLHPFRIHTKKFRYTLELFQPTYGSSLDAILESIKRLSNLLGDINDCVSASKIVAGYQGGHRLARRLRKRQHKKIEAFQKYWDATFREGDTLTTVIDHPVRKPAASSRGSTGRRKSVA